MKWARVRLDFLIWRLRSSDGMDDRELLLMTLFWLLFAAIVILAFSLGLAKVGM